MSRKSIITFISSLSVVAFTAFSLANALALDLQEGEPSSEPLTAPVELCRQARASYKQEIDGVRAKGLSLQIPQEELRQMLQDVKDYRTRVCDEAAQALTSPVALCKQARKRYSQQVGEARAKGLSLHLSKKEVNGMIAEIRDYQNKVCKEAKAVQKLQKKGKNGK